MIIEGPVSEVASDLQKAQNASPNVAAAATDDPGTRPDLGYIVTALILIILGIVAGANVSLVLTPATFVPAVGVSVFAIFYVLAQTLERLGELLTLIFPKHSKSKGK